MRRGLLAALLISAVAVATGAVRPVTDAPTHSKPRAAADLTAPLAGARSARNASYVISTRLDARAHRLDGREVLTWRNISRASASELPFHLYYNAWKDSRSTFMREAALAWRGMSSVSDEDRGWTRVTAIRLLSSPGSAIDLMPSRRFIAPDDGNGDDQTVMSVALPRAVLPGETVQVAIEWTAKIPRTIARTGVVGDYYFLGQWFPKVGVLEDGGWNCHQFHASTEFFADYGVYDVSMTVPRGWVVGATGIEQSHRNNSDGTTTWRYLEEDVHDFAWTTSPHYVERRERFAHQGLPPVEMRLLLQPEHVSQAERHFRATRAALRYYGQWFGAYPYTHITIVDPAWQSGAGGMEYPTLFTAGTRWLAPAGTMSPEGVTIHECGHQFWYALVGNNEFEDAWLDEGLNTYSTARVIEHAYRGENHLVRRFFGFLPYVFDDIALDRADEDGLDDYRRAPRMDVPSTPSFRYWPASGGVVSYSKTALWLHTLENYLGWPTFRRCLATYFDRWKFRHPKPSDFFQTVNDVSGRDLTWFFDQVYRDSRVFDYGIDVLSASPGHSLVVARRYADGVFPVNIRVRFQNGEVVRVPWDGRDQWKSLSFDRRSPAVSAEVDPDHILVLDVNPVNNSRTAEPPTDAASTKWAVAWMVWLQDLLVTYAFLV